MKLGTIFPLRPLAGFLLPLLLTACGTDSGGPPEPAGGPPLLTSWGSVREGAVGSVSGLQFDADGTLYALDAAAADVQKFGASGAAAGRIHLDVAAVTGLDYYSAVDPRFLSRASDGSFLCLDANAARLLHFSATGAFLTQWSAPGDSLGHLRNPVGLVRGAGDHLYVLDDARYRVLEFAPSGEFVREFGRHCSDPDGFEEPGNLAAGPDGTLYVVDNHLRRIGRFDAEGRALGVLSLEGIIPGEPLVISGLSVGPGGHLFASGYYGDWIYELGADGQLIREFTLDGDPGYGLSGASMTVGEGFFVYQDAHDQLWRKPLAGGEEERLGRPYGGGPAEFSDITQMVVAPDGTVFVLSQGTRRLQEFDAAGHLRGVWDWQTARADTSILPGPLAVDAAGTLFAWDNINNEIVRLGPGRRFVSVHAGAADPSRLPNGVRELVVARDHTFVVRAYDPPRLERLAPDGTLLARLDLLQDRPADPNLQNLLPAGDGELWALGGERDRFVRLSAELEVLGTLPLPGLGDSVRYRTYARGFAFDADGNITLAAVLVPDTDGIAAGPGPLEIPPPQEVFLRIDRAGRPLARWGTGGVDLYTNYGFPMAHDGSGRLFLADTHQNRIYVYGRGEAPPAAGGFRP